MIEKVETVVSVELPVDETLAILKKRFSAYPSGENGNGNGKSEKRISIVTGIHGDELEGQFVCYEIQRRIREHPEYLEGIVDIYPALNPFGLGSDVCIDIHASNIYLTEVPQIRINELTEDVLMPYACLSNVDLVWVHGASTVLEATLAYSLNSRNVPTLVVEMGVGMRITQGYGKQLVDGIFRLMKELGIWSGPVCEVRKPVISKNPDEVIFINAPKSGIFIKDKNHGTYLEQGEHIGSIVDPLNGELLCDITAPKRGWLFTIREYPVLDEGSLIARILNIDESECRGHEGGPDGAENSI